jgi:hypothetical protein
MEYTLQQLETQYKGVVARLAQNATALAAALDYDVPFFRGEDCRADHRRRHEANIAHIAARIKQLIEAINQVDMTR